MVKYLYTPPEYILIDQEIFMPLYEFICADCGKEFEKVMRFDQSGEQPPCPACESRETHKRISLFSSRNAPGGSTSSGSCGSSSGGFT